MSSSYATRIYAHIATPIAAAQRLNLRRFAPIRRDALPRYVLPAFVATLVFYVQMLKDGGSDAGFLYTGDVLGYFWPALVKLHQLFHAGHFTAIDFSSYNASSPFLLTANLYNVHPFVVLPALLLPTSLTFQQTGYWLVLLLVAHSFIGMYFTHRMMCEFFGFRYLLGALVGLLFAFSYYVTSAMGEPPFTLSIAVLPWIAYAALSAAYGPNLLKFLWACLPVLCAVLGGYGPLGLVSAGMGAAIMAFHVFVLGAGQPLRSRVRVFLLGMVPFAIAALILSPYLIAVLKFNAETISAGSGSLFFSAQQLAEAPQAILRILSPNVKVTTPFYEFTPTWGLSAVAIAAIFFTGVDTIEALSRTERSIFFASLTIYSLSVLAIYGVFSPVSNLVYDFVPVVGKMHIYQRFLYATSIFYAVIVTLMIKAIVVVRPPVATRAVWLVCVALCLTTAYVVDQQPSVAASTSLSGSLVFEFMLAALVVTAFLCATPRGAFVAIAGLLFLPLLGQSYTLSQGGNTLTNQRSRMPEMLDDATKSNIVEYLKKNSRKSIIKYVDMTPFWAPTGVESFPKAFPYFVLDDVNLSSYGGFSFYLSSLKSYMDKMPVQGATVALQPDWDLARAQGADFVVALAADVKAGRLEGVASSDDVAAAMPLPNEALLIPLRSLQQDAATAKTTLFDNGYFRLNDEVIGQDRKLVNLAIGRAATASGGIVAGPAVDGNTDGDYGHGSITHSGRDPNAWLDVDLGAEHPIDDVTIWGRTDCCGERLRDYWLFLSDAPFPASATAAEIAKMPGVWSVRRRSPPHPSSKINTDNHVARYVRVQFGASVDPGEAVMSIAELQVFEASSASTPAMRGSAQVGEFETDNAGFVALTVTTDHPVSVDYLLTLNPNLAISVNGTAVVPTQHGQLMGVDLPAGRSRIVATYSNPLLSVFWIFYVLYFGLLALAFTIAWIRKSISVGMGAAADGV